MELSVIRENSILCIEFELNEIAEDNSLSSIGSGCERITGNYRSLAICRLLMDGDTYGFYHDLIRSAHTRRYYVSRCHNEKNVQNRRLMASLSEPFFDALASNQWSLAVDIALLSSQIWWEEEEYEDDFCYAHFFHQYISFSSNSLAGLPATLDQFENSLEGAASTRLNLCKSFLARDQRSFDEAFEELLDERTSQIETEKSSALGEEIAFQTEQYIFVEGLAILRMAERVGLATQRDYVFCPGIARLPMKKAFPDDGYPKV